MFKSELTIESIIESFEVSSEDIAKIANSFMECMNEGLYERRGPLKMISSFIGLPSGEETGIYYSVDFGGTNLRISKIKLGDRKYEKLEERVCKLRDSYYISEKACLEDIFDFVATSIKEMSYDAEKSYCLGHTFSFPVIQKGINNAELYMWTKEIKTRYDKGVNINEVLEKSLIRNGINNVKPVAILNDTVGTLLLTAFSYENADIASIIGTGHNTCYIENDKNLFEKPTIINIESGNFDRALPYTKYDIFLDEISDLKGTQKFEKMIGGEYLGRLLRLVIVDLMKNDVIFKNASRQTKHLLECEDIITSAEVDNIINHRCYLLKDDGIDKNEFEKAAVIANAVVRRAARLAAASYLGILYYMDPKLEKKHVIGIDGSVYEKMTGFKEYLRTAINECLKDKYQLVEIKLVKDGSGIGGAIAAALFD